MSRGPPERVWGVDFSGAADAGRKVWLAEARLDAAEPRVVDCRAATDRLDCPADRAATLAALRRFVADRTGEVVAVDASFGLPAGFVREGLDVTDWPAMLRAVADRFDDPDALAAACLSWAESHPDRTYVPRATDRRTGASAPYHWLVVHQTYHALTGLLEPLVAAEAVTVLPFQTGGTDDDRPRLVETYPAATLDRLGLVREGYKDDDAAAAERRAANLEGIREHGVRVADPVAERAREETGGHALDAVVAAVAAAEAAAGETLAAGEADPDTRLEGHIHA